jgi:hypothetical protein
MVVAPRTEKGLPEMKTIHRGHLSDHGRVTIAVAREQLRAAGMTVRSTGWGDYRVGYRDQNGEPYFTCDVADALETGLCMAQRRHIGRDYLAH